MSPDDPSCEADGGECVISSSIGWYLWVSFRALLRLIACFCGILGEAGELFTGVCLEASQAIHHLINRPVRRRHDRRRVKNARDVLSRSHPRPFLPTLQLPEPVPAVHTAAETVSCVRPRFSLGPEGSVRVTYEPLTERLTRRLTCSPTTIEEITTDPFQACETHINHVTGELIQSQRARDQSSQTSPQPTTTSVSTSGRTVGDFVPSPSPAHPPRRRSPRRHHPETTIS